VEQEGRLTEPPPVPDEETGVVRVSERHLPALVEFYRETWDTDATLADVRLARANAAAGNPAAPGAEIPTFLFLSKSHAVGHLGTIPIRLWHAGRELPLQWLKGLMVLPEHRNGPVGFLVLKEALRQLEGGLAMVVQPAPRRLFTSLGFTDLGGIPNYIRILNPRRVVSSLDPSRLGSIGRAGGALRLMQRLGLAHLVGGLANLAFAIWTTGVGSWLAPVHSGAVDELDPASIDRLWALMRDGLEAAPVRDAAYLRWRYGGIRQSAYRTVSLVEGTALAGIAIVRRPREDGDPRLRGVRVATLCEILFPWRRPAVGSSLIGAAINAAREVEADALLCSASHPVLASMLRRQAFFPIGKNVHFLAKGISGRQPYPSRLTDWWLMRGDSEADEVF